MLERAGGKFGVCGKVIGVGAGGTVMIPCFDFAFKKVDRVNVVKNT